MKNTKKSQMISVLLTYFVVYIVFSDLFAAIIYNIDTKAVFFAQFAVEILVLLLIVKFSMNILNKNQMKIKITEILQYYFILVLTNAFFNIIISFISQQSMSQNQAYIVNLAQSNAIYLFFAAVIFAPITEELVFRGAIYGYMRKKYSIFMSVLASSLSFALMHFIISIFTGEFKDLIFLPTYIIPGVILCLAYEKNENIFLPITIHFLNNFFGFLSIIAMQK